MTRETTRRAVLGAMVGAGVAGGYLSPAGEVFEQFAPLSGSVWGASRPNRPSTVENPYGEATLYYDDEGVPHVDAADERALYFAAGHAQAVDRGFQMDLQRRLFSGRLSEVVGEAAVESDRFHRQLCFREAAEATAEHLEGTVVEPILEAYAEGVTAGFEDATLPIGFQLLGYEPEPWTPTDSMLVEKIIAWQLTGSFRTLRRALVRDSFGPELTAELYRGRLDHDSPIIRERHRDPDYRLGGGTAGLGVGAGVAGGRTPNDGGATAGIDPDLVDWLSEFEPEPSFGSNSWVIGSELSAGDGPTLSNDPHLSLQAPPVWYEMHLDGPDHRIRGVTFPGVPTVIIGESDFAAWGFTNATNDVIDFYTYDRDGETYSYGGETREFETREEEIPVDGAPNQSVTVRKSVHGPVIEESEREVGVAWTGHAATETTIGLYELTHSSSFEETLSAIRKFESPTQNFLYADRDENTLYYMVGRHPIRSPDGEAIPWDSDRALRGDRVFDGSAREGEWTGFEPFTRPSWDGFVPFEEKPHVVNPEYLATANQEIIPDEAIPYYLAEAYGDPYRGQRIYQLLDERVESGDPVDWDFLERLGRDVRDGRAASIVDNVAFAARNEDDLADAAETLENWDYRMTHDSEAALVFHRWIAHYREDVLGEAFEDAGLDEEYYPRDGRLIELPPESDWFGPGGREGAMRRALRGALAEIDEEGAETYGDISHTGLISHLTELDFLGYPELPRGGSGWTVRNYGVDGPWGGGWEMQVDLDGEYRAILAGGNSGRYYSEAYDSQLERWANGEYRSLSREIDGERTTEFVEGDR
mgnify:CR=1 FL=1